MFCELFPSACCVRFSLYKESPFCNLLFPGTSVACKCLPGVNVEPVPSGHACKSLKRNWGLPVGRCPVVNFPWRRSFGTRPSSKRETRLRQGSRIEYGVQRCDPCPFQHCVVGYFVSPGDDQDASQAAHVEGVESSFWLRAQSPFRKTGILTKASVSAVGEVCSTTCAPTFTCSRPTKRWTLS